MYRPGESFGRLLSGLGKQIAYLSIKAVQYDPYRQSYEKRLTRYLSWQWRCRAKSGMLEGPYRVSTLLGAIGLKLDPNAPSRTKERLETALDRLDSDKVTVGWQYDGYDENALLSKGWAKEWLQSTLLIEPPDVITGRYLALVRPGNQTRECSCRAGYADQTAAPTAWLDQTPTGRDPQSQDCRAERTGIRQIKPFGWDSETNL